MSFGYVVGDVVTSTSLVLQLITGLQDNSVLEKFSEETPVYFALLVEVKDLMSTSPEAIPASARAALDLVERRQVRMLDCVREFRLLSFSPKAIQRFRDAQSLSFLASFPFRSKSKTRSEDFEKMMEDWKASIVLLRDLTADSITHNLLHHVSTEGFSLLPPSGSITEDRASIGVTIACAIESKDQWMRAKGLLDTQGSGNWISRELVKRAGLQDKVSPVTDKKTFIDAQGSRYKPEHHVELTWYPNRSTTTRVTDFLISDGGPFDVLFGKEFLDEERKNGGRAVLSIFTEKRTNTNEISLEEKNKEEEQKIKQLKAAEKKREQEREGGVPASPK